MITPQSRLREGIKKLEADIEAIEADKSIDVIDRVRLIAAKQHKILCRKTRIDLLDGKANHEAYLVTF